MMRVEIKERLDNNTFKVVRGGVSSRITLSGLGDYSPEPGTEAFVIPVGNDPDDFVMVAVNDGKTPESAVGERLIYSVSGGDVKAVIHLKNNGEIVLNGGTNTAVQFEALSSLIASIEGNLNANYGLISTAIVNIGGAYTPQGASFDASSLQVEKVKL